MPKISARIRSFFGPKGRRKSKDRSRGRKNRRSSEPVVRGTQGDDKKNKSVEKRTQSRPQENSNPPSANKTGAKPPSPLTNPQSDSKPSSLAKVENSDSGWLVVDKDRDILIENPEIQNADSVPSYSTHIGRSHSAATTPKSRSDFLDTDFVLPSREHTAHRLVTGKAQSQMSSSPVPSSPVLAKRAASLVGENPRSLMLRSLLPDPPNTAIRNTKSSRSASMTPTTAASDAAVAVADAPGNGKRSESMPLTSLHPTFDTHESDASQAQAQVQAAATITQQIRFALGEDIDEGEGEEDDTVIQLTHTLHKFNLSCTESATADRLVEEEYEGREGNSGGSSDNSEKRFMCNICQNGFKFKRSLTRHMKSTHEGGFGTCRVCGDVNFSQKVSYEKHLQKSQKHLRKLWELIASRDPSRRKADYVIGGDVDPARAKFDRVKLDASLRELALDHLEGIVRRVTVPFLNSNPFKPEMGFLRQCPICNIIFQNDREFIRHCASHEDSLDLDDPRLADLAGASVAGPGGSSSRSRSREIDRHLSVHRSPIRDRSRSPIRSRASGSGFHRNNFSRRSASSDVDPAFRSARGDSPLSVHADDLGPNNMYATAMAGGHPNFRPAQSVSPQQPLQPLTGLGGLPQRIQSTFSDTLPLELARGHRHTTSIDSHAAVIPPMVSVDPALSLTNADYSLMSGTAGALSLGSGDGVTIKGEFDMLLAGGGTPSAAVSTGFGSISMAGLGLGSGQQPNVALDPRFVAAPLPSQDVKPLIDAHDLSTAASLGLTSSAASVGLTSSAQFAPQFSLSLPTNTQGGLTLGFTNNALPSQFSHPSLSLSQAPALGDAMPHEVLAVSGPGLNVGMSVGNTRASVGASISSSVGASTAFLPRQNSLSSNHGLPPPSFRVPSNGRSHAPAHLDADVQALIAIPWTDADEELIDQSFENPLLNTHNDPMLPTSSMVPTSGGSSYNDAVFNTSASASAVLGGLQMPTIGGDSKFEAMDLVDQPTSHFLQAAQLHQEGSVNRTIKLDLLTRAAARERSKKQLLLDTKPESAAPSEACDPVVTQKEKVSSASSPKSQK